MQDPNKINCTQIAEMLGAFRDMELDLAEVEIVEAHLADCPACRQELAAIEMVVASLKSLPELPSKDFADAIEARINEKLKSEGQDKQPALALAGDNVRSLAAHSRRPHLRTMPAMLGVAALLLLGFVAAITLSPKPPTEVAQVPVAPARFPDTRFPDKRLESDKGAIPPSEDIVALYDEEGGNNVSDVGISTNEDGLYAIKM